jgi:hypothetical protein
MMTAANHASGTRKILLVSLSPCLLVSLSLPVAAQPQPGRGEELPPPRVIAPGPTLPPGELSPAPLVAPPLPAAPEPPVVLPAEAVLQPGQKVTLRIRQVLPPDGLSPGERLLNSRPPIAPGDRFLAEIVEPACNPAALVGGTVTKVTPPGCFGRSGYVTLQLSQLVESMDGAARLLPWQLDLADHRTTTRVRRALVTALFGLEGAAIGAVLGSQNPNLPTYGTAEAIAAGAGMLLGIGYASFQRGVEANLEQGDTFQVVIGTRCYRPLPRDLQTILYPATQPGKHKGDHHR